jgi:hypothetical protein
VIVADVKLAAVSGDVLITPHDILEVLHKLFVRVINSARLHSI